MKVLLVLAHPLPDSLCAHLAGRTEAILRGAGHEVEILDLYAASFAPALTAAERANYGTKVHSPELASLHEQLSRAEALILLFPTWWFSMPAILKGWFDRVWSPGIAFDPGTPIKPRLTRLRACLAVTTLGSPWWFDWFVMWRPVARVLRRGLLLACAPAARFEMLSLYSAEAMTPQRIAAFEARLQKSLKRLE